MNRLSFVAGAAASFVVAAGWSVLHSAPVQPVAADHTLGMALMSAVVAFDGTLIRAAGAVSVSKLGTGVYDVTFDRGLLDCSYVSGVGAHTPGGASTSSLISANPSVVGSPATVRVTTQLVSLQSVDASFHLLVFCHK